MFLPPPFALSLSKGPVRTRGFDKLSPNGGGAEVFLPPPFALSLS